jgi:3-oxoacyl-(acyl-carrier-protein) synthase
MSQSMIGHCLGAAGGLEAIATIKAIQTGWLHPSINQFVSAILAGQFLTPVKACCFVLARV